MARRSETPSKGDLRKRLYRERRKAGRACALVELGASGLSLLIRRGHLRDAITQSWAEVSAAATAFFAAEAEKDEKNY